METYTDLIHLDKSQFNKEGFYCGPFEVSQLINCDVEIEGNLGCITFRAREEQGEGPGLCTTGRILVGKGTDLKVHGPIAASKLIAHNSIYATHEITVGSLKCRDNVICEGPITVTKFFYVGGRLVTPRLKLSSLEIQLPQRYYSAPKGE